MRSPRSSASVQLKDVPTLAESGNPGVVLATQVGAVVPAATPRSVIRSLNNEFARAMKLPEALAALIRTEMVRMQAIVKDVKLD